MPKAIRRFTDKFTQKTFNIGSEYEGSNSRISELIKLGFLDEDVKQDEKEVQPETKHIGGGWYELQNGEKVKGKDKAYEVMNHVHENR